MILQSLLAAAGVAALLNAAPAEPALVVKMKPRPDARAMELARRYVRASGQEHAMRVSTVVTSFTLASALSRSARSRLSEAQSDALEDAFAQAAEASVPGQVEERARLYAQAFTEAELEALLAAYDGPEGAVLSDKMREVSMGAGAADRSQMLQVRADALAAFCRDQPRSRPCRNARGAAPS